MYVCMYVFLACFLCVSFVHACGPSVGNHAKEVVCICVTKSKAERFIRVGLIELTLFACLCACVWPVTLTQLNAIS